MLEYAWDLNPEIRGYPADDFSVNLDLTGGMATVIFRRDPRSTDLHYALEISNNPTVWTEVVTSSGGAAPTGSAFVSEDVDPGNPQTLRVIAEITINLESDPRLFLRLDVSR